MKPVPKPKDFGLEMMTCPAWGLGLQGSGFFKLWAFKVPVFEGFWTLGFRAHPPRVRRTEEILETETLIHETGQRPMSNAAASRLAKSLGFFPGHCYIR